MTTLTKISIDGVEYDLGGNSGTFTQEQADWATTDTADATYIKNKPDLTETADGGWALTTKTVNGANSTLIVRPNGAPQWKSRYNGTSFDPQAIVVSSMLSPYAKTADLGSLATKSSITHSEVSDWSTATASFLTEHQDLNGWLPQAVAKANIDLNTIVEQGVYNVSTSSANSSAHHYPVGVNGIMIVLRTNSTTGQGFCQQYFRRTGTAGTNDHHMYVREASSGGTGTWGAWVQLMTSKNLSDNGGTIATTSYVDGAIAAITDADSTGY